LFFRITTSHFYTQPFYCFNYKSHFFKTQLLFRRIQMLQFLQSFACNIFTQLLQFIYKILQHVSSDQLLPSHHSANNHNHVRVCRTFAIWHEMQKLTNRLFTPHSEFRPLGSQRGTARRRNDRLKTNSAFTYPYQSSLIFSVCVWAQLHTSALEVPVPVTSKPKIKITTNPPSHKQCKN
jgi:hypothetical protein